VVGVKHIWRWTSRIISTTRQRGPEDYY